MKSCKSAVIVVLVLILRMCCLNAQEDIQTYAFVNHSKKTREVADEDKFYVSIEGSNRDILRVWDSFVEKGKSQDSMQGRLILRRFPSSSWNEVSKLEDAYPAGVLETCVVDFGCDYTDFRFRQDFCFIGGLTPENVDDQFSVKKTKLFAAHRHANTIGFQMFGVTPDYQLTRSATVLPKLSLPKKIRRSWPTVLDFRASGWFSFSQWMNPTSVEQWEHIVSVNTPVALKKTGDQVCNIYFYMPGGSLLRVYEVDTRRSRVIQYVEYPVLPGESPVELVCEKKKSCHTCLHYDDKVGLTRFALGDFNRVWRGDFVQKEIGEYIGDELFRPESFHENKHQLVIDDSIRDALLLLSELGVNVDSLPKSGAK